MSSKEHEINEIMGKYDTTITRVYKKVLEQEKNIKNIRKGQLKSLVSKEIIEQVQKSDN